MNAAFFKEQLLELWQRRFVRSVAVLQVGSFGANVSRALINVLLARLLQPELFGIYALAFSMAEFTVTILGFGTQEAVTTVVSAAYVRNDRIEAKEALGFFLKMTGIVAMVLIVASLFLPMVAQYFYQDSAIGRYAGILVIASVISMAVFPLTGLGLQVAGNIGTFATVNFFDQFLRFGISLGLTLAGFGLLGAVGGHVAGALIMFIVAAVLWGRLRQRVDFFPSFGDLVNTIRTVPIRTYFRLSFWITIDKNLANLYGSLPILISGLFLSVVEVSYFRLALSYINLALSLLVPISVLLNVEFPKLRVIQSGAIRRKFILVSLAALSISVILTIGAIAVAPWAIRILYGAAFLPSVTFIQGLVLYGALFGIGVGLGSMWRALDRVKSSIVINIATLAVGIPLGIFLIQHYGPWGAVATVTLWYTISHLVSFLWLTRSLKSV